jgi:hypothetical protein
MGKLLETRRLIYPAEELHPPLSAIEDSPACGQRKIPFSNLFA